MGGNRDASVLRSETTCGWPIHTRGAVEKDIMMLPILFVISIPQVTSMGGIVRSGHSLNFNL